MATDNSTSGMSDGMAAGSAMQAVFGAWAAYQQGKGQRAQFKAQANIAEINSRIAEMQAQDALRRGHEAEAQSRQSFKKLRGSQRAALAAQGIRVDAGSAQDIQQETEDIGEFEALTLRNNAARQALGYRGQGAGFDIQAIGARAQADIATRTARVQGTSSLLTGGMQAASYYQQGKK